MNETEIIKDKIQEILRTQKVSKYDLALDIGISHATLYNFLTGKGISQKCLNKLAHFVRTYVTPDQKIEAYKLDAIEYEAEIKELKAENDRLKRINDKLHSIIRRKKEQLKTVNYMLFEEKDMTKNEWKLRYKLAQKDRRYQSYRYMAKKYKTCLQEIKEIAEENKNTVQYGGICRSILAIISKAEEE